MANEEHLRMLKQGVEVWNRWREENPDIHPNLRDAILRGLNLVKANLRSVNISRANLSEINLNSANLDGANLNSANLNSANLVKANLNVVNFLGADLRGANLKEANLISSNFRGANLKDVDLSGANLLEVDFNSADLDSANFSNAVLYETVLSNVDLSNTKGIETCQHSGPSIIDHRTLARSGQLPPSFLRGVGLPDTFIDYIPSLFNQPIQFYSCFISYSSRDEEFAQRLHSDLQDKGVRCWYAPEDLPIGAKIRVGIDQAIRKHDKLLLVLSEHSVKSQWVEQEVETALEQERQRDELVLFPVRLDNAVMESGDGWTRLLKNTRNIGNFTDWKDYDSYQKGFKRLVRDLKAASETK